MADPIDYRALFEQAERDRKEAVARAEDAEKQLAKTTFSEFLDICHSNVFLKLDVQKNKLLSTTGGMTRVDDKQYPRRLKPWTEADALFEESFAVFERAFQQQKLLPSSAGLQYIADKLSNTKLASEEDLKNFECLAVEGCVLDVIPRFLELVSDDATIFPFADPPSAVSFNSYPFGVIATESDEDESESEPVARSSAAPGKPSRGRIRNRSRRGGGNSRKPLLIKDDRPAYIGALGVAKRDMDSAIARTTQETEERDRSGPPKKRPSPQRTKVHPDQWCFRHSADGTVNSRPLFVVEYKAAHKIDATLLRDCLEPDAAASLMEDAIRTIASQDNANKLAAAKRDIAKVLTQTYHYMVDYGLQYSYATTGHTLVFLYLDPQQPSTLYYHLEEPKLAVLQSSKRDDIKHSAVALVLAFFLMSMKGQYMTQRWKKSIHKKQPKWPQAYGDMKDIPTDTPSSTPLPTTAATLASRTTPEAFEDPQKQRSTRQPGQDDAPTSQPRENQAPAAENTAPTSRTTQSSSAKGASGADASQSSQQTAPEWAYPVNAPLSPALAYCTQACLLSLKTGGKKDAQCPNVNLHQRCDADADAEDVPRSKEPTVDEQHPISADELRALLTQQLADDMDHDCQNLERYGKYGAIGVLFKLALTDYGYCFVGKGVQRVHRKRLEKEAMVYGCLGACQGRLVPVNLGVIELVDEYWTECGAHISHMMLMSFAGSSLWHHTQQHKKTDDGLSALYRNETLRTLKELEPYGVKHGDENDTNMVWNEELQRVMLIDFDQATVLQKQKQHSAEVDMGQKVPAGGHGRRKESGEKEEYENTITIYDR